MKVKYQYDYHKYMVIDVDESQVELVKELNRDFERNAKAEKKWQSKKVNFDSEEELENALYKYCPEEFDDPSNISKREAEELERSQLASIRKAMKELPEKQQEVLLLHFDKEMTFAEIASQKGISWHAVKKTYVRAIKNVRKILGIEESRGSI